jgi:hypothetical protein
MSLGLVRFGAGFFEEGREARQYMRGVERVQVAMYKVKHLHGLDKAEMPSALSELLTDDDWEVMVKTSEPEERVWVLYREDGDVVRDIHLTVLSDDELIILRVSGHINDILDMRPGIRSLRAACRFRLARPHFPKNQ